MAECCIPLPREIRLGVTRITTRDFVCLRLEREDERTIDDVGQEVARLRDQGYERVKVMLGGDDAAFDQALVERITTMAPGRLAVDAHWSWSDVNRAARTCQALDDFGLGFIEDPFAAIDVGLMSPLKQGVCTPLAAGEDVFRSRAMRALAADIDVLRVDATTCGGITGALKAVSHAGGAGKMVFPHVFLPLHVHLAAALPGVDGVEMIPEESGADRIEKLLGRPLGLRDGVATVNEEPGVGVALDWEAIGFCRPVRNDHGGSLR